MVEYPSATTYASFFLLQPRFLRDSGGCTKGLLFVRKSAGAAYIELSIYIDDIIATHSKGQTG